MKTKETKTEQAKDRVDALVDSLDSQYFRIGVAGNLLDGSEYLHSKDFTDNVALLFETPSSKSAEEEFFKMIEKITAGLPGAYDELEGAAIAWKQLSETFPMLLGFVLGLRMAGIDSERTKQMARTWRLGYPQEDKEESRDVPG